MKPVAPSMDRWPVPIDLDRAGARAVVSETKAIEQLLEAIRSVRCSAPRAGA